MRIASAPHRQQGSLSWWATVAVDCVLAWSAVAALPALLLAGPPLLLGPDPAQSVADPRARFWAALVPQEANRLLPPASSIAALQGSTITASAVLSSAPEPPPRDAAIEFLDPPLADAPQAPPPPVLHVFTVHPRADASIVAARPNTSYGTSPDLRVRGTRLEQRSILDFDLIGTGAAVQRATLRLYCLDGSDDAGSVHAIAPPRDDEEPSWTQEELSWNNAPHQHGAPIARLGRVVAGSWTEIDVTEAIGGDGIYGFVLVSRGDDMAAFASREGLAPPELAFTTAWRCEDGNTEPAAVDDSYVLEGASALETFAPGVLENDSDFDGDELFLVSSTQPTHGVLRAAGDGSFDYRPEPGYFGPDSFTYTITDRRGGTRTATVAVTVQPGCTGAEPRGQAPLEPKPNDAPASQSDTRIVPNPSRGPTRVEFDLVGDSRVEAAIYDARGHRVRLLAAGRRPAGRQQLAWNGADDAGSTLPAGIYFLRLRLGGTLQRHKIVLQH